MRTVEASIEIKEKPEKIINVFTELNHLSKWWNVDRCFIDLTEGGNYTLIWGVSEKEFQYVSTGTVKKYVPGKILHITNWMYLNPEKPILGPVELIIESKQITKEKSLLIVKQGSYTENAGDDWDWYFKAVKEAWPEVLKTLKTYIENNVTTLLN